jgi:hypothetical protein
MLTLKRQSFIFVDDIERAEACQDIGKPVLRLSRKSPSGRRRSCDMLVTMDPSDDTRARGDVAGSGEAEQPLNEPVRLPTEDVLDLHAFTPKEIPSVIEEYLELCQRAGMSEVRLIHGKGTGTQRAVVRRLLANHPDVLSFADAPPEAGGWGATLVRLKPLDS